MLWLKALPIMNKGINKTYFLKRVQTLDAFAGKKSQIFPPLLCIYKTEIPEGYSLRRYTVTQKKQKKLFVSVLKLLVYEALSC